MQQDPRGATSAQLQADIDAGVTGDKVSGFDPAAAPLGTDEEAGGTPPTPEIVAHARAQEAAPALGQGESSRTASPKASAAPDGRLKTPSANWLGVGLGLGAAALLAVGYLVVNGAG